MGLVLMGDERRDILRLAYVKKMKRFRYRHLKPKPRMTDGTAVAKRDRALMQLGFASYRDYLRSHTWATVREETVRRQPKCAICGDRAQCVHHLDYSKLTLAGKKPWKLVALCNQCHTRVEFRADGTKRNFEGVVKKTKQLLRKAGVWERYTKRGQQ